MNSQYVFVRLFQLSVVHCSLFRPTLSFNTCIQRLSQFIWSEVYHRCVSHTDLPFQHFGFIAIWWAIKCFVYLSIYPLPFQLCDTMSFVGGSIALSIARRQSVFWHFISDQVCSQFS